MFRKHERLISADVAKEMIVNHANEFSDMLNRREKALLIGGGTACIDKCPTVFTVIRCTYRDGNIVTFAIPNVAYLMSDTGKTIDKIVGACVEELGDSDEAVYNTLQDAVNAATKD